MSFKHALKLSLVILWLMAQCMHLAHAAEAQLEHHEHAECSICLAESLSDSEVVDDCSLLCVPPQFKLSTDYTTQFVQTACSLASIRAPPSKRP